MCARCAHPLAWAPMCARSLPCQHRPDSAPLQGARIAFGSSPPAQRAAKNRAPPAKKPRATRSHGAVEKEVGSALLSRAPERSIIAAGALNGRVRDGNGCFSPARAANQRVSAGKHTEEQPCPAGRQRPRPPASMLPALAPASADVAAGGSGQASRPIRTPRLSVSPRLRLGPVNPVVSRGPSGLASGMVSLRGGLALRCFQRLSRRGVATRPCQ